MTYTAVVSLVSLLTLIGNSAIAKNLALESNDINDHFLSTNVNFLFDMFLKRYTTALIQEDRTEIQTEDFENRFSTKILTLDIEAAIIVRDGWCKNISTIHRTGDAIVDKVDGDFTLSAHVGLNDLELTYNNYDVSLLGAHQKGKINIKIGQNSIWLKLLLQLKPHCNVSLERMRIETLDDFSVDITNLGIFENLTDDITSWVISEVSTWYRSYVEDIVFPELSKAIQSADLCRHLPFHSS